jgi:nucleotide-binding universal stress UspA family protein
MAAQEMTSALAPARQRAAGDHEPFGLIVCGVDGGPSALEAVRQAGALAGPNTTIELLAVTDEWGSGPTAGALLSKRAAKAALAIATAVLSTSQASVICRSVAGHHTAETLLNESRDADLLVLGRHGYSRVGGILTGSTATYILHHAEVPVLLAIKPPDDLPFPGRILVAADGPDHPEDAVRVATHIAPRSGSSVTLLRIDWSDRANRPEVADAVAELQEKTGAQPVEILVGGDPHKQILEYARSLHVSLVVTGSRGLAGIRALRSVSERVAHESSCSVLVVHRPRPLGEPRRLQTDWSGEEALNGEA